MTTPWLSLSLSIAAVAGGLAFTMTHIIRLDKTDPGLQALVGAVLLIWITALSASAVIVLMRAIARLGLS